MCVCVDVCMCECMSEFINVCVHVFFFICGQYIR